MKRLLCLWGLITPFLLFARLGETPAQCEARYGKGEPVQSEKGELMYYTGPPDFDVSAMFRSTNGGPVVAVLIYYRHKDETIAFTEGEVTRLLQINHKDELMVWRRLTTLSMFKKFWASEDNTLMACSDVQANTFGVASIAYLKEAEQKQEAQDQARMKGL